MKKIFSVCICVSLLSACVPAAKSIKEAPIVVTQKRALSDVEKNVIQESVRGKLKDPDSAKFSMPQVNENGAPNVYCGLVNAKNSYGGYTGFTPFMATLVRTNGEVKGSFAMLPSSSRFGEMAMISMCKDKGYSF